MDGSADGSASIFEALNIASKASMSDAADQAYRIFMSPPERAAIRPEQQEVHERALAEDLIVDGKNIRTYRWGNGERPAVLVHGSGGRASNFSSFVPEIEALGLTVIAYDALGHGESDRSGISTVPHHREILQHLQDRYGTFHSLIGHSFGGISIYYAARTGVKTERLVSLSSFANFSAVFELFCQHTGLRPDFVPELRIRAEHELALGGDIWTRFSPEDHPEQINAGMLVVHDEDDPVIGIDQGRRLASAYSDRSHFLQTHGLGHYRVLASPLVIRRVVDFLAS
jgi:pimeloyl-ACP methyl ester carboxylesterase